MAARKTPTNPDEANLRALGLSFPATTEDFPWGHRALKVKGKTFCFMGTGRDGGAEHDDFFITVKLPHTGTFALGLPRVKPTGYGLGKSGWVSATWPRGRAPVEMLREWLRESYCAVAPTKLAAQVDDLAGVAGPSARAPAKVSAATKKTRTATRRTTKPKTNPSSGRTGAGAPRAARKTPATKPRRARRAG